MEDVDERTRRRRKPHDDRDESATTTTAPSSSSGGPAPPSAAVNLPERIRCAKSAKDDDNGAACSSSGWELARRVVLYSFYGFWFLFGLLVVRKTLNGIAAVAYIKTHANSVSLDRIEASPQFVQLLANIDQIGKPPAILLLNQHALNMTFNFLCNTQTLEGVHERLIFVTLDSTARDVLATHWPTIKQFYWPTPALYQPFSFMEGPYQTIYLLRANLAVALIKNNKSFWMMQQDTFWRKNLFELGFESDQSFDALFDQIGVDEHSQRAEWVNGANFFVHANNRTLEFFRGVGRKISHWFTPDMGVMIHQCHTWSDIKCRYIPHKIAHSWEWMYTKQHNPPYIMQLDCETDGNTKLQQLAKFGFYFTKEDGRTCDPSAVEQARDKMLKGQVVSRKLLPSWGRFQFTVYWHIVDWMLYTPVIGPLLKPYLALAGFCLMVTM